MTTIADLPPRMARKIMPAPSGCWIWLGGLCGDGYGFYRHDMRQAVAHRHVYELLIAPIPAGLQLDHLCRTRRCVNPLHLDPVTPRVNTARSGSITARNLTKTKCAAGHPLVESNVYHHPKRPRVRDCRTCRRARDSARTAQVRRAS